MSGLRERLEALTAEATGRGILIAENRDAQSAAGERVRSLRAAICADYEPIDGLEGDDYGNGISTGEVEPGSGELELRLNVGNRHGSVYVSREFWAAVGEKAGWDEPPWTAVENGLPEDGVLVWALLEGKPGLASWCWESDEHAGWVHPDGLMVLEGITTHWKPARIPSPPGES